MPGTPPLDPQAEAWLRLLPPEAREKLAPEVQETLARGERETEGDEPTLDEEAFEQRRRDVARLRKFGLGDFAEHVADDLVRQRAEARRRAVRSTAADLASRDRHEPLDSVTVDLVAATVDPDEVKPTLERLAQERRR